jgi:hypothetical protein
MRYLILFGLLAGCGISEAQHRTTPNHLLLNTEQPLAGYLLDFLRDCDGSNLRALRQLQWIRFTEPDEILLGRERVVGVCVVRDGYSYIKVKRMASEIQQKALLYHELGHCVLRVGHKSGTLMASKLLSKETLTRDWDRLVPELCSMRLANDPSVSRLNRQDPQTYSGARVANRAKSRSQSERPTCRSESLISGSRGEEVYWTGRLPRRLDPGRQHSIDWCVAGF